MKRRIGIVVAALLVAALCFYAVYRAHEERARKKRESQYQAALTSFSESLKPGMTRKDVEGYLSQKKLKFQQLCCVTEDRGTWDDLTQIGKDEYVPWFCSEHNVYIAFQFKPRIRPELPNAQPTDILTAVTVYKQLEGCL